ncbi:MAG: hypothetical protein GXC94_00825 [Comamonadaceae bacterium]|jgi:hypothetical protein|nr:hypothetical protein [Comamonadaceae bacterium]
MKLRPETPPGHASRKALGYEDEIASLRSQGYKLSAIRKALAAAGVYVSLATVGREAARAKARGAVTAPSRQAQLDGTATATTRVPPLAPVVTSTSSTPSQLRSAAEHRSGKDIAEEFRRRQTTNPFIRAKEQS